MSVEFQLLYGRMRKTLALSARSNSREGSVVDVSVDDQQERGCDIDVLLGRVVRARASSRLTRCQQPSHEFYLPSSTIRHCLARRFISSPLVSHTQGLVGDDIGRIPAHGRGGA